MTRRAVFVRSTGRGAGKLNGLKVVVDGKSQRARVATAKDLPIKVTAAADPADLVFDSAWEEQYAGYLELLKRTGVVRRWRYHILKIILPAKRMTYEVDFVVEFPDGRTEIHEIKGFMREDAWMKLKLAARAFPFWPIYVRSKIDGQRDAWTRELVAA